MEAPRIALGVQNAVGQREHLPQPPRRPGPGVLPPPPLSLSVTFLPATRHHGGLRAAPRACQPPPALCPSAPTMPSGTCLLQHPPRRALSPPLDFKVHVTAPERGNRTPILYSPPFPTRFFLTHSPVCFLLGLYRGL